MGFPAARYVHSRVPHGALAAGWQDSRRARQADGSHAASRGRDPSTVCVCGACAAGDAVREKSARNVWRAHTQQRCARGSAHGMRITALAHVCGARGRAGLRGVPPEARGGGGGGVERVGVCPQPYGGCGGDCRGSQRQSCPAQGLGAPWPAPGGPLSPAWDSGGRRLCPLAADPRIAQRRESGATASRTHPER